MTDQTGGIAVDFKHGPCVVIWETTRACALKCVHCRAEAIDRRDPDELDTRQAFSLLEEIRRFGCPLMVLTGGDPLRRPDLEDIVEYGTGIGLPMAVTPSGTYEVTPEKIGRLKQKGLRRVALSLDGPRPDVHDEIRGVTGSYRWTMDIIRWAGDVRLPVQINTTIGRKNFDQFNELAQLLESLEVVMWSVFFLVPVGRAALGDGIRASEFEKTFHKMADIAERSRFRVKSTEAPHYRRVLVQRQQESEKTSRCGLSEGSFTWSSASRRYPAAAHFPSAVNDGKGFVFISHTGEIWPSGFLPLSAGNVRKDSLVDVYRRSELFSALRDPSRLKGKCGACEYKTVCGGSRARAFNLYGDYLAPEPFCAYVPKGYKVTEMEKVFLS